MAVFVLGISSAENLNIPFLRANIKLVVPFFNTFTYIMTQTALITLHKPLWKDQLTVGGARVMIYFVI